MSRVAVICFCLLLPWTPVMASGPGESAKSTLWESVLTPGLPAFRAAMARGKKLHAEANSRSVLLRELRARHRGRVTSSLLRKVRQAKLQAAVTAFSRAVKALPGHSQGHLWHGRSLYDLQRHAEAAPVLAEARKHAPRLDLRDAYYVAASLGIAYSKLERLADAVREYDRAVRLMDELKSKEGVYLGGRSTQLYNAAESLMALGRLDEAILRYRAALSHARGSRDRRLIFWGLAVAHHRDDQTGLAREVARKALKSDPKMRLLTDGEVFFVPEGEIHYYFAVGYWAQDQTVQAQRHWHRFLDKLPQSPWAARAREQLDQLGKAAIRPKKPTKRLAPRPGQTRSDEEGRDRRQVSSRLYNLRHSLRRCYTDRLRKNPKLEGRIKMSLLVSPKGTLKRAKRVSDTIKSAALWQCVQKKMAKKYFGRMTSKKPITVDFTLEFKPGR